jgi:hypothetical protein
MIDMPVEKEKEVQDMRKEGLCVSTTVHSRSILSGVPRVVSQRFRQASTTSYQA